MFTRLRSSTLSSGYDRNKLRGQSRQFGMFEGRSRKLSANRKPELPTGRLFLHNRKKKPPFGRIILRNRKPELPHPEVKTGKGESSMQPGEGYIRKLRLINCLTSFC